MEYLLDITGLNAELQLVGYFESLASLFCAFRRLNEAPVTHDFKRSNTTMLSSNLHDPLSSEMMVHEDPTKIQQKMRLALNL
ncbi:hypothetical protein X798_03714 [Onchocerca flexuosa]|nr:hypothetical protein X798_03714 [Onchocerca flexuosa]